MDNFKKRRRPNKEAASIDGFVSDNRRVGLPSGGRDYKPNRHPAAPTLDQFIRRSDGFYPVRQAPRSLDESPEKIEAEALLDEPIVLDDAPPRRRHGRFLHRFFSGHPKTKKVLKRTVLVVAVSILAGIGYMGYKFYHTQKQVLAGGGQAPAVCGEAGTKLADLQAEGDGRVNVLLLGIGGPGHDGSNLTDTIMLASIDPINNKMDLVSIPRDLWVKIPSDGYQKLNAAYAYGLEQSQKTDNKGKVQDGLGLLDSTLEPVIGVPIHYHVLLDFAAFRDIVNDLGGVTVNVTQEDLNYPSYAPTELYDPTIAWENHNDPIIAKIGTQTMNGQQALLFARSRETSSDFARAQRQRLLMTAIKQKALSTGTFSNPVKIVELLNSLGKNVYTDFNTASLKCLYQRVSQIPDSSIASLDLVKPPHDLLTTGAMNGLSIVEPKAGLFDYSAIQSFLHTALRDGFIAKENSGIAVYNATDIDGLAGREGATLKSIGYSVTTVANAPHPTNPPTTIVVDLTSGKDKYTRHYLEQRFKVTAVDSVPASADIAPPAGTDFVIILGRNAQSAQ